MYTCTYKNLKHDAFYENYHNYRIFMQPKYLKNNLFLFKNITNQKYNLVFLKYYVKLYQTLT